MHFCCALVLIIIESSENEENTLCKAKVCRSNVIQLICHVLVNLQQIPGYTAGTDYPTYSEVPQGGSFSCQNRLPGKFLRSFFEFSPAETNHSTLQDIMLIWKQDVRFGTGVYPQDNDFLSFARTEQFSIK